MNNNHFKEHLFSNDGSDCGFDEQTPVPGTVPVQSVAVLAGTPLGGAWGGSRDLPEIPQPPSAEAECELTRVARESRGVSQTRV